MTGEDGDELFIISLISNFKAYLLQEISNGFNLVHNFKKIGIFLISN